MPLGLHITLRQKWGGGICSNIQKPLPSFLAIFNTHEVNNHNYFLKEWHELQEISSACDTSKQLALSVVTGENPT